jgi:predicted carbohydrate-binding protein with CBM5 and CBM33 domain
MTDPPARNAFCGYITKPDQVANGVAQYPICGQAFNATGLSPQAGYSFMAVLTHTLGYSVVGARTNVCSFNSETWSGGPTPWDQPIDWPTTAISSGPLTITWNVSWGPHFSDTAEFRYWITRSDFVYTVGKALSFSDFEAQPFCVLSYDDFNPTANPNITPDKTAALFKTRCTVPQRSGRHVIYGEWGRLPTTYERFHGCIDVTFGGTPAFGLSVTKAGTGAGTVTASTGGLSCGSTCSASYTSGASVSLVAAAAVGSTFAGWGGGCSGTAATCTVSMTAAQSVTATFNATGGSTAFVLSVAKSGTGGGTVYSTPTGITCGTTCSASYANGTAVTLIGDVAAGSTFAGWSGACSGTGPCTVTMSQAQSVTATFTGAGSGGGGGGGGGGTSAPCANPTTFKGNTSNFNSTGAVCYRTNQTIQGWGCSNFAGRTVSVNGGTATSSCGAGPFALPKYTDGYTYFTITAGTYPWTNLYVW